jgi:O-antigen/teichoic acid export membrane protein
MKNILTVFSVLASRSVATALGFMLNVMIARLYGAENTGYYYLFLSWRGLVSGLLGGGYSPYVTRNIAVLLTNKKKPSNIVSYTMQNVLLSAFLMLLLVWGGLSISLFSFFLGGVHNQEIIFCTIIAGIFLSLVRIMAAAFKGLEKPRTSIFLEFNAIPFIVLTILFFGYICLFAITLTELLWLFCLASALTLLIGIRLWNKSLEKNIYTNLKPFSYQSRMQLLNKSVLHFWLINILSIGTYHAPFFILTFLATAQDIGQFGVANRLVALAAIVLVALSNIYAAKFAKSHHNGDAEQLHQYLKQSQIYSIAVYFPFFMVFIIFPNQILLLFGDEFTNAAIYLWILAFGQLINALTGLVGNMLNMMEDEKFVFQVTLVLFFLSYPAMLVFGLNYGVTSVAIIYAGGKAIVNILFYWRVRYLLKHRYSRMS